jgi:ATP-binding cassette subfamily F protein uup
MLDRVSTIVLGLNGQGNADTFADYGQWEAWQAQRATSDKAADAEAKPQANTTSASSSKKKLSYLEAREYATIERRVEEAEQSVHAKRAELEDPANATDAPRLVSAQAALDAAQEALDSLYTRWAELEKKNG